jgi:hypothetical protein
VNSLRHACHGLVVQRGRPCTLKPALRTSHSRTRQTRLRPSADGLLRRAPEHPLTQTGFAPGAPRRRLRVPRLPFEAGDRGWGLRDLSRPPTSERSGNQAAANEFLLPGVPRPFRSCVSHGVEAHAGVGHHPTHGPTRPPRASTPARGRRPRRRWLRRRGDQGPWRTAGAAPGHLPHAGPRRGAHSPRRVTSVTRQVPPALTGPLRGSTIGADGVSWPVG